MKRLFRNLWLAALCAALIPAAVRAQGNEATAYYQPEDGGSGQVVPASALMGCSPACGPACGPTSGCACGSCCDDSCCGGCGGMCWPCGCLLSDLGEAHKLWTPCCEDSQWVGAGWLAQGYVWNPYRPADRFNGPMTWNDRANEYQMNELYYYFGRVAKTDECCLDWGARIDTMYGTNYRWNTSAGFETNFDTNNAFYGLAIPQLYAQLGYNNWDIKVGRWFSPVGYYVIGTANNFFATLPYTFQYGEPFTHTGIIASKKLNDKLTVAVRSRTAGIAATTPATRMRADWPPLLTRSTSSVRWPMSACLARKSISPALIGRRTALVIPTATCRPSCTSASSAMT